jgi:RecB family exonuclease
MLPTLPQVKRRFELAWEAEYDPDRIRIVKEGVPLGFYQELGIRCLDIFYRRHYPFDRDETLGIEERVEFDLDEGKSGEYRMQGIIDRIARAPDGAIEIQDYKTGNYVPNQKRIDEDKQLALYQLGLAKRFPNESVRLVWHYVSRGIVRQSVRTPEQLDALRDETMALIDATRAETEFEPKKSALCDWCEFKGVCPAFNPHALPPRRPQRKPRPAPTLPSTAPEQLSLL